VIIRINDNQLIENEFVGLEKWSDLLQLKHIETDVQLRLRELHQEFGIFGP
jgi:hypothetical protein